MHRYAYIIHVQHFLVIFLLYVSSFIQYQFRVTVKVTRPWEICESPSPSPSPSLSPSVSPSMHIGARPLTEVHLWQSSRDKVNKKPKIITMPPIINIHSARYNSQCERSKRSTALSFDRFWFFFLFPNCIPCRHLKYLRVHVHQI